MLSSARSISAAELLLIGAIMALGAGFLGYRLGWQDFWWDEYITLMFTRSGWRELLVDQWGADTHRPVYYAMQKGWNAIFGESVSAVRALPATIMLCMVPLFYLIARRLFAWPAAPLAAAALVTTPIFIEQAREVRMYSLMNLTLAGSLLIAVVLAERAREGRLNDRTTIWLWLGFATLQSFSFYVQAMAVIVTALFGIWILVAVTFKLFPLRFLVQALFAFGFYLIISIPAIIPFFSHLTGTLGDNFWIPEPTFDYIYGQQMGTYDYPIWGKIVVGSLLVWGTWCLRRMPHIALLILLMVVGLPALVLAISFFKPIFIGRVVAWGAICAVLIMIAGLAAIKSSPLRWCCIAAFAVTQVSGALGFYPTEREVSRYTAFHSELETFDPDQDALVMASQLWEPAMRWYYPAAVEGEAYVLQIDNWSLKFLEDVMISNILTPAEVEQVELPGGRLFVLSWAADIAPGAEDYNQAEAAIRLAGNRGLENSILSGQLRLDTYDSNLP